MLVSELAGQSGEAEEAGGSGTGPSGDAESTEPAESAALFSLLVSLSVIHHAAPPTAKNSHPVGNSVYSHESQTSGKIYSK